MPSPESVDGARRLEVCRSFEWRTFEAGRDDVIRAIGPWVLIVVGGELAIFGFVEFVPDVTDSWFATGLIGAGIGLVGLWWVPIRETSATNRRRSAALVLRGETTP